MTKKACENLPVKGTFWQRRSPIPIRDDREYDCLVVEMGRLMERAEENLSARP
jgi:hypothetical protein